MLRSLTKLSLQRNWKEAIVFYLAYTLLGILIAGLSGGIAGIIDPGGSFESGAMVGTVVGTIYCVILYFSVYSQKRLNSFLYILIGIVAGVVNLFCGNLVSIIFVAFLTTRATRECKASDSIIINDSGISETRPES